MSNTVSITPYFLTNNECYQRGVTMVPKGIMVHSTGANNPMLKRYIQPDDGMLGKNSYGNHWNQARPGGRQVCVHAFIGKLADGTVAVYQTLPWTMQGWHAGGSANRNYIGFEICEDGLSDAAYFSKIYEAAVQLSAHLCQLFSLDPTADGVILCHSEGYKRGISSNHADVTHWFPKHGKTMNTFRSDVKKQLNNLKSSHLEATAMTQQQFDAMMENWLKRQDAKQPSADWILQGVERAKAAGITDGSCPMGIPTRAEVMIMAASAAKKAV